MIFVRMKKRKVIQLEKQIVHRCAWAENVEPIYQQYHDEEWGVPVYEDQKLFEMLILEGFQAGLSWLTILKKRENFRKAFDQFEVTLVAAYDENKIAELMQDSGIVRNRRKINAAIQNGKVFLNIQKEFGSFSEYLWGFTKQQVQYLHDKEMPITTPLSDMISNDLKKRGMKFVGSTIIYSYLQAVGVVNDHSKQCDLHVDMN